MKRSFELGAFLVWVILSLLGASSALGADALSIKTPLLLVHGIDDTGRRFDQAKKYLKQAGYSADRVIAIDLIPNNGDESLVIMGTQVGRAASHLKQRHQVPQIDIVAFSMGSVITRHWLFRQGGHPIVRKFISISGPHHGSLTGFFRDNLGAQEMRPKSAFIESMQNEPFHGVEVHSFWTPLDLMIIPAESSIIEGAINHKVWVLLHPLMLLDKDVWNQIIDILKEK